jgi:hypothetical protein
MVEQAQRGFGYNLIGAWGPSNQRYTGDQATAIQTLGALERAPLYYFYRPKESEMRAIRRSLSAWRINDVLVTNPPGAPNREVGASSSQTIVAYTQLLGMPEYSEGSWHWKVPKDLPPYLSLTKSHYLTCAITTPAIDPLAVPRCVMRLGTPTAGR